MNISKSFVLWQPWVRFLGRNLTNFDLIFDPVPLAVSGRLISRRFFMSTFLFLIDKTDRLQTHPESPFTTPVLSSVSFNAPGEKVYSSLTPSRITRFRLRFGSGLKSHSALCTGHWHSS